jgi:hypothetical protein
MNGDGSRRDAYSDGGFCRGSLRGAWLRAFLATSNIHKKQPGERHEYSDECRREQPKKAMNMSR